MVIMRKHFHRVRQLFLGFILATSSCAQFAADSDNDPTPQNAAWIALSITNGKAVGNLNLIAGQEYIFDRITLAVDNRSAKDNLDALDWLRRQSSFSVLNWDGVRESRAHWRNYRESRTDADLYSHVFEVPRYGATRLLGTDGLSLSDFPSSAQRVSRDETN